MLAATTVGCAKSQAPAQPSASTLLPASTHASANAGYSAEQANRFVAQGDYDTAIAAWKAITEKEPTADHYNELSYAYLQAMRWQEALAAAEAALKLAPGHKYATYNAGMAALELGDLCKAMRLADSVRQQPDRYEPHMGLARVFQLQGDYPAALRQAQKAVELSPDAPDAPATLSAIESMRTGPVPGDLATVGLVRYRNDNMTLYMYPEKPVKTCDSDRTSYTLYSVHKQGKTLRLPVGTIPRDSQFEWVALPGGVNGFVLRGGPIGATVSRSSAYSLWVDNGQEIFQVRFVNKPPDQGGDTWLEQEGPVMRAGGVPSMLGDLITGHYMSDANGYNDVYATWRLAPDLRVATLEDIAWHDPQEPFVAKTGTVVSITAEQLVITVDGKDLVFPTAGFEVRQSGWPGNLRELKPGAKVELAMRDGKLLRLEFSR